MAEATSLDVLFFLRFYLDTGPLDVSGPPINAYPVSLSANASTDVLTLSAGSLLNGTRVRFYSTGALPGGLSLATDYWVINSSGSTFKVSATKGGSAVNITSTGSGTISARIAFEGRVISWGSIDRSCAMPAGLFETGEATIEMADPDGAIRAAFDAATPLRRIAEIYIESRTQAGTVDATFLNRPIYRGQIANAEFTPGHVSITVRDAASAWLGLPIPPLVNRRNFPNLPDGHFEGFAPIIFGRLESYSATNVTPQGRFPCQHVDTATNSYLVARHACHARIAVYRKRPNDDYFTVVDTGEYSTTTRSITDSGVTYTCTIINFTVRQDDGTDIRADFSGVAERPAIGDILPEVTGELRNPVDAIINLCLLGDDDDDGYDNQSFLDVRTQCAGYGFYCDGAIDQETTIGAAIADICSNFGIHFFQNQFGQIALRLDPGIAFTANAGTNVLTITGGAFADGTEVAVANVGGTLPAGLYEFFQYFVRDSTGPTFKLALTAGGAAIDITDAGTGTQYIGPKTQVPATITKVDTLFRTVNAKLNQQPVNRLRYRYCRNWGLNGKGLDLLSSVTLQRTWLQGEWGWEDVVDQTDDSDELGSLAEEVVELNWVTDPDQALRLVEDRGGYLALRSYRVEFELAAPEWFRNISVATPIYLTHIDGIGDGGFAGAFFKVEAVSIDLGACRMKVSAVRQFLRSELTWSATWDPGEGHPAHGANVRSPATLLQVNGDSATTKAFRFSDDNPEPPPGYINVGWQIDLESDPNEISAFIPEGAGLWAYTGLPNDSIYNFDQTPVYIESDTAGANLFIRALTDEYNATIGLIGRKSGGATASGIYCFNVEEAAYEWALGTDSSDGSFNVWMGFGLDNSFKITPDGIIAFPQYTGSPTGVRLLNVDKTNGVVGVSGLESNYVRYDDDFTGTVDEDSIAFVLGSDADGNLVRETIDDFALAIDLHWSNGSSGSIYNLSTRVGLGTSAPHRQVSLNDDADVGGAYFGWESAGSEKWVTGFDDLGEDGTRYFILADAIGKILNIRDDSGYSGFGADPTRHLSISSGGDTFLSFNTVGAEKWVLGKQDDDTNFILFSNVLGDYIFVADDTGDLSLGYGLQAANWQWDGPAAFVVVQDSAGWLNAQDIDDFALDSDVSDIETWLGTPFTGPSGYDSLQEWGDDNYLITPYWGLDIDDNLYNLVGSVVVIDAYLRLLSVPEDVPSYVLGVNTDGYVFKESIDDFASSSDLASLSGAVSGLSSTVSGLSSSVSGIASWLGAPFTDDYDSLQEWGDANYGGTGWLPDGFGGIYNANDSYVTVQNPTGDSALYIDAPGDEAGSAIYLRSDSGSNWIWSYSDAGALWRLGGPSDGTHPWALIISEAVALDVDDSYNIEIPNGLGVGNGIYSVTGMTVSAGYGIGSTGSGTESGIVFDPDIVLYGTGSINGFAQVGFFSGDYDALSDNETAAVFNYMNSGDFSGSFRVAIRPADILLPFDVLIPV